MPEQEPSKRASRPLARFLALVPPHRRGRWGILMFLSVLAAFLEAAGGLLIFGVLGLVQEGDSTVGELLTDFIQTVLPNLPDSDVNLVLLVGSAVFFVVRSVALLGLIYLQGRISQSEGARLSTDLVSGYLSADYEFHLSSDPSVLIRNVMVSVDNITLRFLLPISRIVSESLSVMALVAVLLFSAPGITLIAALAIGLIAWIVMRIVRPRLIEIGRENQDLSGYLIGNLTESLEGVRDVIVTGSRWRYLQEFGRSRFRLAKVRVRNMTLASVPRYVVETLLIVGVLGFLAFEVSQDATGESIALIGLFAYTALRTLPAVNRVNQAVNDMRVSRAAVDDVIEDMQTVKGRAVRPPKRVEPLDFSNSIVIDGVSFRYRGAERMILDRLALEVRAGESVGIAGPTGSGKSTLVDIILGLLHVTAGEVRIDGMPMDRVVDRWHRTVGVVSQKVFLANTSLLRNIALTESDDQVDRERAALCVEIAQLGDLVGKLEHGLDTRVGGTGVRLSGGERQRVAVARALYRSPKVLLLDEATSAIDGATEANLIEAVLSDDPDRTLIMVAHRINTLRHCDRIVVMLDGRIDAIGSYEDLMSAGGVFARMSQSGEGPDS